MANKFKPCPFCSRESQEIVEMTFDMELPHAHCIYYVRCTWCGAEGPSSLSESGAIERWDSEVVRA